MYGLSNCKYNYFVTNFFLCIIVRRHSHPTNRKARKVKANNNLKVERIEERKTFKKI